MDYEISMNPETSKMNQSGASTKIRSGIAEYNNHNQELMLIRIQGRNKNHKQ